MLKLTDQLRPTPDVKRKAQDCYIRKVSLTQYIVTPKRYAKSRRLVTFIPGSPIRVLCEDYRTKEQCPANEFGSLCYHALRAILHLGKLAEKERAA